MQSLVYSRVHTCTRGSKWCAIWSIQGCTLVLEVVTGAESGLFKGVHLHSR